MIIIITHVNEWFFGGVTPAFTFWQQIITRPKVNPSKGFNERHHGEKRGLRVKGAAVVVGRLYYYGMKMKSLKSFDDFKIASKSGALKQAAVNDKVITVV